MTRSSTEQQNSLISPSLPENSKKVINAYLSHDVQTIADCINLRKNDSSLVFTELDRHCNEIKSITFKELYQQVTSLAFKIQQLTEPGDRVLLLFNFGLDFIIHILACLYAGSVAVPLNIPTKRGITRFLNVAKDCSASIILTTPEIKARLEDKINQVIDEADQNQQANSAALSWHCLNIEITKQKLINSPIKPDSLAILQYTSGSTGKPKGVQISHKNIMHNCAMICSCMEFGSGIRQFSWLPLFHDMGLFGCVMTPIFSGAHSYHMSPADFLLSPRVWLESISRYQIHITGAPNFAYDLCIAQDKKQPFSNDIDLSSLKVLFNGAEPILAETIIEFTERFQRMGLQKQALMPCYGMAETTLLVTCNPITTGVTILHVNKEELAQGRVITEPDITQSAKLVSSGVIAPAQLLKIVNPEKLTPCNESEIGEIWVSGQHVSQGYFSGDDPETPAFIEHSFDGKTNHWLRTGDLGFIQNGQVIISGRRKDLIIIRGKNYYPQDIERLIENSHPDFQRNGSASFTITDNGELVAVAEVIRHCRDIDSKTMLSAATAAVANELNLQLNRLVLIRYGQLKKTSSGKVQRFANRQALLDKDYNILFDSHLFAGPKLATVKNQVINRLSDIEQKTDDYLSSPEWLTLQVILNKIVKQPLEELLDAPFASLGIDSIKAIAIVRELEKQLCRELPATLLWECNTPSELAMFLIQNKAISTAKPDLIPTVAQETVTEQEQLNIAVIGVGLRLSDCLDINDFWLKLNSGESLVKINQMPDGTIHHYAAVEDAFDFDYSAFGITPSEALTMDPQQRWVLHAAGQAIEQAGYHQRQLKNTNTGVYIGFSSNDYGRLLFEKNRQSTGELLGEFGHAVSGNAASICANRVSYFFDLKGPSLTLDTACSSSLVAIIQACEALQSGQISLALAGGVQHICDPAISDTLSQAKMLSPRNRCEPFSSEADGYARGEGCVIYLLKRLDKALQDRDPIHGIIAGWAINQDGLSNGLTAPSSKSQVELYKSALDRAQISSNDIDYIEAHGTGTPLGDPIETGSLNQIYASDKRTSTCLIGSVKASFGHLESAAGAIGMLKALAVIKYRQITAQPPFTKLNPHIKLGAGLAIARESLIFPPQQKTITVAVNSFGFGGTNACLVVKSPAQTLAPFAPKSDRNNDYWPIVVNARSRDGLATLAHSLHKHLTNNLINSGTIEDISWTLATGRAPKNWCMTTMVQNKEQLIDWLAALAPQKENHAPISKISLLQPIFLFPGQGSQQPGMALDYYQQFTVFKAALDQVLSEVPEEDYREVIRHCLLTQMSHEYMILIMVRSLSFVISMH